MQEFSSEAQQHSAVIRGLLLQTPHLQSDNKSYFWMKMYFFNFFFNIFFNLALEFKHSPGTYISLLEKYFNHKTEELKKNTVGVVTLNILTRKQTY